MEPFEESSLAAVESGVEAVPAPTRAEAEKRLKLTQREAKHARLRGEMRKSKPQGATAYHWGYFQTYAPVNLQMYAICKLCWEQGELDRAEVKYNQSPTNLLRHLNTGYPGHQAAYEACKGHKAGNKNGLAAGGSVSGSASTGQEIVPHFRPDTSAAWHRELVRWMVTNAIPFSMLEDACFQGLVRAIRSTARVPDKESCISTMRDVKENMVAKLSALLKGEHVCITADGWTSGAGDTYMSLTISLINSAWKLVTLSVGCSKSEGTMSGDALAGGVRAAVAKHALEGKITAITTDCEPSSVRMARILEEGKVCVHIGCCNHRLEKTIAIVFDTPGVKSALALARSLVARYSASSQMADRLAQFAKIYIGSEEKEVIQDEVTRWWSTCGMVGRLLELKRAIDKHEEEDALKPMLTAGDWTVLELIFPILEPFMQTQASLEDHPHVTGSLVVPFIYDLRASLDEAIEDLQEMPCSHNADIYAAKSAVMPCVLALREDFVDQWGDGSGILTETVLAGGQPRGFKPVQVLATAVDPRTKILYGVEDEDHANVWEFVQKEAVKIALQNRQDKISASASSQQSPSPAAAAPAAAAPSSPSREGNFARKRRRSGGFMEIAQSAGRTTGQAGGDGDNSTASRLADSVRVEVEAFRARVGIKMYEPGKEGDEGSRVYLDPLDWWRVRRAEFPHLASLARRVLAVPATQAESERLLSCAGDVVTNNRDGLPPGDIELLVLLRHSWEKVEKWEASNAAVAKRGSARLV